MDLDDTLYATEDCHASGLEAVNRVARDQLSIGANEFNKVWVAARRDVKDRLGTIASSHSRLLYAKRSLELLGLGSQLDLITQIETAYWGSYMKEMRLSPGALKLLEASRELAIPVYVLTDLTAKIQMQKLIHLKVHSMIAGLVTSEDVGEDKPSPGFVSYLADAFSVKDQKGWLLGDDKKDEQMAAELSGMTFHKVKLGAGGDDPLFMHLVRNLRARK